MKRLQSFQYAATAIASLGLVLPSGVLAAEARRSPVPASAAESQAISDVSLGEGGTLNGQVLNGQGLPLAKATVTVRSNGNDIASAATDVQGRFSIHGLRGGVYELTCGGSSGIFRLWTANASPPSAKAEVLLVAGGPISRGQCYQAPGPPGSITNGQIIFGALVAAGLVGGIAAWAVSEHQSAIQPAS
jgi:hypothetical protein